MPNEIGETVDYYKYKAMPHVSKSKMRAWGFCEFNAWLGEKYEDVEKPIEDETDESGITGTNAHLTMALFWPEARKRIDDLMRMKLELDFKNSQLYWAFMSMCNDVTPREIRGVPAFNNSISNFAQMQVDNWIAVSKIAGTTKIAYEKYWLPVGYEVYMEDPDKEMYGTVDVYHNNINFANDGKPYIFFDYKTGHVPKAVEDFRGSNMFGIHVDTSKMQELHFYAWLIANGKMKEKYKAILCGECSNEILREDDAMFRCSNCGKEFGFVEPIPDDVSVLSGSRIRWKKLFKNVESFKDLIGCFVFLGGTKPFVVPKKMNDKTMENTFRDINLFREKWDSSKNDPDRWEKNVGDWTCPRCYHGATCTEIRMRGLAELK